MAHEPGTVFKPVVKLPRDLNQCWPWLAQVNSTGTPVKQWNGKPKAARRWLYELLFGAVGKGREVYGTCGSRDCINPKHATVGTAKDRVRMNEATTLSTADVRDIREAHANGVWNSTQATKYGVTEATICDVVAHRTWT